MFVRTRFNLVAATLIGTALLAGLWNLVSASQEDDGDRDIGRGLTGEQEDALYSSLSQEAAQKQQAAARDFVQRGGDPRALRQVSQMSVASAPPASLMEALAVARVAVSGRVRSVEFTPAAADQISGSLIQFEVEEASDGKTPRVLVIHHPAMLEIDLADPERVVLSVPDFTPMLFDGDRALLLLGKEADSPFYYILPFVGEYKEESGALTAVEGNPFANELEGKSPADAMTIIKSR